MKEFQVPFTDSISGPLVVASSIWAFATRLRTWRRAIECILGAGAQEVDKSLTTGARREASIAHLPMSPMLVLSAAARSPLASAQWKRACLQLPRFMGRRKRFMRIWNRKFGTVNCAAVSAENSKRSLVEEEYPNLAKISWCANLSFFYNGRKEISRVIAVILIFTQISLPLPMSNWEPWFPFPANAVLYSPDTKVPRTGELALRKAIPANSSMKAIQESLEDISYLLRIPQRKPYGTMENDVKKALKIATEEKDKILSSVPAELKEKGSMLYTTLLDGKGGLQNLIGSIKEQDPDKVSVGLASSLDTVAQLELLQAPGLSFLLPQQYMKYPRLTGRATVEFTIEKVDGSAFFPSTGGDPKTTATIQVVIDGYSAPLTSGNFAKLVIDGAYDRVKLKCASQAILSDNELDNYGYSVPLEVKPSGQFEPLYKTTLSVQDGELPVLPLSVYGAVAMAHNIDSDEYSSPTQFFFYLYDKRNSGLGGLSFDEGQFSVFGYTVAGKEILSQIKTGDIIQAAKLVQGKDRLLLPDES